MISFSICLKLWDNPIFESLSLVTNFHLNLFCYSAILLNFNFSKYVLKDSIILFYCSLSFIFFYFLSTEAIFSELSENYFKNLKISIFFCVNSDPWWLVLYLSSISLLYFFLLHCLSILIIGNFWLPICIYRLGPTIILLVAILIVSDWGSLV